MMNLRVKERNQTELKNNIDEILRIVSEENSNAKEIYERECPQCKKKLSYSNIYHLNRANKKNTLCYTCCTNKKFKNGYKNSPKAGFQKGNLIWSGKHLSQEHKNKLSESHKGKLSHFKGKSYSEIYGSKSLEEVEKRRISRIKYHDSIGRKFQRPNHSGYLYKRFTKRIFERDDYTCQLCGKRDVRLQADHYPKSFSDIVKKNRIRTQNEALKCPELWDINNGRTLCVPCHKKTLSYGSHAKKISLPGINYDLFFK